MLKTSLLHNDAPIAVDLAVLIDTSHEFVVLLLALHLFWEPLLEVVGEFDVQIIYSLVSYTSIFTIHTSFHLPELASLTESSLQRGQWYC